MKPILILDAFITDDADEQLLYNFIETTKIIGDDILLMSNTKISKKISDVFYQETTFWVWSFG